MRQDRASELRGRSDDAGRGASRYHDPLAVGTGVVALWTVGGLAIASGRGLLRVVPIRLITLTGAAVMAVLAVVSLISVIRG